MTSMPITNIIKGDSFSLEGTLETDITGWKLRCEIYDDCGQVIKLATENSGGSDDDIEIIEEETGNFIINVAKNLTTNFATKSFIEIEAETADGKIYTIHQGEINFKEQRINWEEPS